MHVLSVVIGDALLLLIGIAAVLALVVFVLYLVGQITRMSGRISVAPPDLPDDRRFSWEVESGLPDGDASIQHQRR